MGAYRGRLEMSDVADRSIEVSIDLGRESIAMRTPDGFEIGAWPLEMVHITGRDDGFTFQIDGIPAWLRTNDDGAFATEVGLRWAPPRLRRLMAVHTRSTERDLVLT